MGEPIPTPRTPPTPIKYSPEALSFSTQLNESPPIIASPALPVTLLPHPPKVA